MKTTFKVFSVLFVIAIATQAQARIMLEPYLGYEMDSKLKLESSGTDIGGKTSGTTLGARVAYALPTMVWFGVDYSLTKDAKFKGNFSSDDGKVDRSNLYVDVGVDLPVLARVWAGYGIMNSSKYKFDSGGETTLKDGTAIKLGVGFTALPLVSINVEVTSQDYKNYESGSFSGSVGDAWETHKETGLLLSVSAPFKF